MADGKKNPPPKKGTVPARGEEVEEIDVKKETKLEETVRVRMDRPQAALAEDRDFRIDRINADVTLQNARVSGTNDQAFWVAIRNRTEAIGFRQYDQFIRRVFCEEEGPTREEAKLLDLPPQGRLLVHGVDAYQLLKTATEVFLILRCGIRPLNRELFEEDREQSRLGERLNFEEIDKKLRVYLNDGLPYISRVLGGLTRDDLDLPGSPYCEDTLVFGDPFDPCLLELIWSYWHEEGMLVQAINAIGLRFQNKRTGERNPLTQLELSPLRPLSNILWGYVQDEPFRLTVARRAYEYSHHYGLSLVGKAVPVMRPADNRSKFLEAFHSLLRQTAIFYKEDADTTVIADGFPIMNGLQEVHMLLAEGAHNQFRDLPWTARAEMLIQQWLLSRREMQEFLRGRPMVPYKENWMGQADTLRRLFGWGDTPVTHFRDLAVFGEQILLSIRYGDWVDVNDQDQAKNWARYWKPEIQGYIHAYRAVTGIDLGAGEPVKQRVDATLPSILLQRRIAQGAR